MLSQQVVINLINLKKTADRLNNVKLYIDSNNIAKLMNESSLVITTRVSL